MHTIRRTRSNEEKNQRPVIAGGFRAALTASLLFVILLLGISAVEYFVASLDEDVIRSIVMTLPIVSVGMGTCFAARRLGRAGLWLSIVSGGVCFLFALAVGLCMGADITLDYLRWGIFICLGSAILGAILGNLCVR